MSIPKEPRQLMINLMYLVLTALLALNVSNEILNAFKIINKSINRSNSSIGQKNEAALANFATAAQSPKYSAEKRARIAQGEVFAKQAHEKADSMISFLTELRDEIVRTSGGMVTKDGITDYKSPENLDAATYVMLPEGKNRAKEMKARLEAFKKELAALVPVTADSMVLSASNAEIEAMLPIEFDSSKSSNNPNGDWAFGNFHMVPVVGAVTIMDKYINDVRNAEGLVMDEIWARAFGETDVRRVINPARTENPPKVIKEFTAFKPILAPRSSYLLPGEEYSADVMVGAYNPKDDKTILIVNGQRYTVKDGVANVKLKANKTGSNPIVVEGQYWDPNKNKYMPMDRFTTEYFVGSPAASIQLDKMNVFYLGVDNPITISASGVPFEKIRLEPSPNLSVSQGEGGINKRFVRASGEPGTKGYLTIKGTRSDGVDENFGTFEYRIKMIPDPNMLLGGRPSGNLAAERARAELGPEPRMPAGFEWDVAFKVVSFNIQISKKGGGGDIIEVPVQGGSILNNKAAEKAMSGLRAGDKLWLTDVRVVGPDKKVRNLGQMSYKLF